MLCIQIANASPSVLLVGTGKCEPPPTLVVDDVLTVMLLTPTQPSSSKLSSKQTSKLHTKESVPTPTLVKSGLSQLTHTDLLPTREARLESCDPLDGSINRYHFRG
jgi:hypothetical protein